MPTHNIKYSTILTWILMRKMGKIMEMGRIGEIGEMRKIGEMGEIKEVEKQLIFKQVKAALIKLLFLLIYDQK